MSLACRTHKSGLRALWMILTSVAGTVLVPCVASANNGVELAPSSARRASAVSNAAPILESPGQLELVAGAGFIAAAQATDPDADDVLSGQAVTPLAGLTTSVGKSNDGKLITTVRGIVPASAPGGNSTITWTVSDNVNPPATGTTAVHITRPMSEAEVDTEIRHFLQGRYTHGVPYSVARKLGPSAVGPLCAMLRDINYKKRWSAIAQALAMIGTPATFDSLRAFVWDRFSGVVEGYTLKALIDAHGSICYVAGARPEVLQYLMRSSDPAEWTNLPWRRERGMESLVQALCEISINGIGTIPSAEARNFLLDTQQTRPDLGENIREALDYQDQVIRLGREGAWMSMMRRLGGPR